MSNFSTWWDFCQRPQFDGSANDTANDGAGATRWGWTYPTWWDAMVYCGRAPSLIEFSKMDQKTAGDLAQEYIWQIYGGTRLAPGVDVSVVDWAWNSGRAGIEYIQTNLRGLKVDGIVGPKTLGAIAKYERLAFVNMVYDWRVAFLDWNDFREQFPGLYTRAEDCKALAISLAR